MSTTYGVTHQRWPDSTQVQISSLHGPDSTAYLPIFTIDNDLTTYWKDNTEGQYPDTLTLLAPSSSFADLTGLLVVSHSDGWIVDYTVDAYINNVWIPAASKSSVNANYSTVNFATDGGIAHGENNVLVGVQYLRISVSKTYDNGQGDFTRVAEVYPIFVESQTSYASTSSSSGARSTSSILAGNSANQNHHNSSSASLIGGIVGAVFGGLFLIHAVFGFFIWRCRKARAAREQEESMDNDIGHYTSTAHGQSFTVPLKGPSETATRIPEPRLPPSSPPPVYELHDSAVQQTRDHRRH